MPCRGIRCVTGSNAADAPVKSSIDVQHAELRDVPESISSTGALKVRVFPLTFPRAHRSLSFHTNGAMAKYLAAPAQFSFLKFADMPIVEVSQQIGFEDNNDFSRRFRQHMHMTPLAYWAIGQYCGSCWAAANGAKWVRFEKHGQYKDLRAGR